MTDILLRAVTSPGASDDLPVLRVVKDHAVQITTTGAATTVTVDLEGSLDGDTFFQLGSDTFNSATAATSIFFVIDKPVTYVRLNLITLTAGTAPTVTAKYVGFERQ